MGKLIEVGGYFIRASKILYITPTEGPSGKFTLVMKGRNNNIGFIEQGSFNNRKIANYDKAVKDWKEAIADPITNKKLEIEL